MVILWNFMNHEPTRDGVLMGFHGKYVGETPRIVAILIPMI
jgi:hypothetical protein